MPVVMASSRNRGVHRGRSGVVYLPFGEAVYFFPASMFKDILFPLVKYVVKLIFSWRQGLSIGSLKINIKF